jgi:hypothetical protein
VVADGGLKQDQRLLSRVVESGLSGASHDHLGGRGMPDRGLIPCTEEANLGALLSDHPARLVAPVIPAPSHREEALVPDHLGHDLKADPLQTFGDLRGIDTRVPDVANLKAWHEFERLGPVHPGVAADRGVAMAPDSRRPPFWPRWRLNWVGVPLGTLRRHGGGSTPLVEAITPGAIERDAIGRVRDQEPRFGAIEKSIYHVGVGRVSAK